MSSTLVLLLSLTGCVFVDDTTLKNRLDPDGDGAAWPNDCDSDDPAVHPGADEVCDGVDQDCDGAIDEGVGLTLYTDADADGFGVLAAPVVVCEAHGGLAEDATDCDDTDSGVFPGADETCDGTDQDCDGVTDEDAVDVATWFADVDGDGFGDAGSGVTACDAPDAHVGNTSDCDDADALAYPGADETCDPGDDDCDGAVDEDAIDAPTWYADGDADGFGDPEAGVAACAAPEGHVGDGTDCDDTRGDVSPDGVEACGDVDEDCDGAEDEPGAVGEAEWYADADGDGYGDPEATRWACDLPADHLADASDCDDTRADVSPAGREVCDADDADEDCDGDVDDDDASVDASTRSDFYTDSDGDGYGAGGVSRWCNAPARSTTVAGDCDDDNAAANPGVSEDCATAFDDDCDGDDNEAGSPGCTTWYQDADADGYGTADALCLCEPAYGYTANDTTDCDDTRAAVSPAGTDACDTLGLDEDCNGDANEEDAPGCAEWYVDADGDGYGTTSSACLCEADGAYAAANDDDCDDTDGETNPAYDGWEGADFPDDCSGGDRRFDLAVADAAFAQGNHYGGEAVAAADLDGDGLADLAIGAGSHSFSNVVVLTGFSGSTYTQMTTITGGATYWGHDVEALADLDGDGLSEILVASEDAYPSGVYYAATLQASSSVTSADLFLSVSAKRVSPAGDVDGDGLEDVVGGNEDSGTYSQGRATLTLGSTIAAGGTINQDYYWLGDDRYVNLGAEVWGGGDLDGDGYDDIALGAPALDTGGWDGHVYVLRGGTGMTGSDTVSSVAWLDVDGNYGTGQALVAADVDGDGALDLAVGDPVVDGALYVFRSGSLSAGGVLDVSTADVTFAPGTGNYAAGGELSACDPDGDGVDGILVGTGYSNNHGNVAHLAGSSVFSADGTYDHSAASASFEGYYVGRGTACADVDGDSLEDVIIGAPCMDGSSCRGDAGQTYITYSQY